VRNKLPMLENLELQKYHRSLITSCSTTSCSTPLSNTGHGLRKKREKVEFLGNGSQFAGRWYSRAVGLYKLHPFDPQLESAWFQAFCLSIDFMLSNFAFKFPTCTATAGRSSSGLARTALVRLDTTLFSRDFAVQRSKCIQLDDSRYHGPCKQSDTRE
jgi:hypothetical protein